MSLTSKGHFKINGTEFVAKSISPSFESLASEDSGRTDDGVMHITWIQTRLHKWEIEMAPCNGTTAAAILSLVQGQQYSLTIYDILTGAETTKTCYTSNSKAECYSGVLNSGTGLWTGLSFSAIEVGTAQA